MFLFLGQFQGDLQIMDVGKTFQAWQCACKIFNFTNKKSKEKGDRKVLPKGTVWCEVSTEHTGLLDNAQRTRPKIERMNEKKTVHTFLSKIGSSWPDLSCFVFSNRLLSRDKGNRLFSKRSKNHLIAVLGWDVVQNKNLGTVRRLSKSNTRFDKLLKFYPGLLSGESMPVLKGPNSVRSQGLARCSKPRVLNWTCRAIFLAALHTPVALFKMTTRLSLSVFFLCFPFSLSLSLSLSISLSVCLSVSLFLSLFPFLLSFFFFFLPQTSLNFALVSNEDSFHQTLEPWTSTPQNIFWHKNFCWKSIVLNSCNLNKVHLWPRQTNGLIQTFLSLAVIPLFSCSNRPI